MILSIIQAIASAVLLSIIFHSIVLFKIKVDIHNLPIIILFLMGIVLANVFAAKNSMIFLSIGFIVGMITFILSILSLEQRETKLKQSAAFLAIISIFMWPQIIMLLLFYSTYRIYDINGSS